MPTMKRISGIIVLFIAAILAYIPAGLAGIKIVHKPEKNIPSGNRYLVSTKVSETGDDIAGIKEVRVYFKQGDEERYFYAPMNAGEENQYTGIIPAPALGARSIDYRIFVIDNEQRFAKTDPFSVEVKDDEQALLRMQEKPPTDVKIDVSDVQEVQEKIKEIDKSRQTTEAERANTAKESGEAESSSRVQVHSETFVAPKQIAGFLDYINLLYVPPVGGVTLASATTVATSAGVSAGAALGGIAAVGVAAAAGGGGSGNGGSGGGAGSIACNSTSESGGDTPNSFNVALGKTSGVLGFAWDMRSIKDRMRVVYQGVTLFDTGCVSGTGGRSISFSGSSATAQIIVTPNCAGTTGTFWRFALACP